jgi:outer membrane protein TolC
MARMVRRAMAVIAMPAIMAFSLQAQGQAPPSQAESHAAVALTLRRAIELALQNSREIQVAKLQASLANRSALISKSQFLPNLSAGSGAGFTYGIPETPGGRAPSLFNATYTQQIFNQPSRGQGKEKEEQAKSQKILLDDARNRVIVATAAAYLELGMVRHSLEVLRKEQDSAERILGVTEERQKENLELPVNVTKDQLMKARIAQRILRLEGREDELEVFLRSQTGLAPETAIDVSPEDLPGAAEQEGANLVAMAVQNSPTLRAAESDVRGAEFRLKGEKRAYYPTLEFVAIYSRLANFNNYLDFFKKFQPNNFNAGVQIQLPLFSAQTRANIALAQVNLDVAKATLADKKNQVSADVRQKTRAVRERDAAKEVARLELQLAQQNVAVFQSQFQEGKLNLRDVERARLEENEKWMAYLDANFQRQQAQLDLLKTAGQLDKVWQ